jgi:hypothetical protein
MTGWQDRVELFARRGAVKQSLVMELIYCRSHDNYRMGINFRIYTLRRRAFAAKHTSFSRFKLSLNV